MLSFSPWGLSLRVTNAVVSGAGSRWAKQKSSDTKVLMFFELLFCPFLFFRFFTFFTSFTPVLILVSLGCSFGPCH